LNQIHQAAKICCLQNRFVGFMAGGFRCRPETEAAGKLGRRDPIEWGSRFLWGFRRDVAQERTAHGRRSTNL
jgi:hypothetical protein